MPAPIVPIGVALARLIAKHGLPAVKKAMTSKGNAGGGGGKKIPKPKSNVIKISTKKPMSAVEQKARVRTDKIKRSPAAQDVRRGNLDNLRKTFNLPAQKTKVTRKNNSPFGPVAAGIVKPTPKGKGPRGR